MICGENTVLDSNEAGLFGGGTSCLDGLTLLNGSSVFKSNSAFYGGGMHIKGSNLTCDNNTVFDSNRAESEEGRISAVSNSSAWFYAKVGFKTNSAAGRGALHIACNSN